MTQENLNKKTLCEQVELIIDDNLEGMISLKDKELMDSHIASCNDCSKYFTETSALIKKLNSLPKEINQLSTSKKNSLWKKVTSNIDTDKYKNVEITSGISSKQNFFSKYKYFVSGIAAVLLIGLIFYGVKNVNFKNSRLAQQNIIGMDTYWKVSNLQGSSMIGDAAMNSVDSIKEGQWIQTNDTSRAELNVANIGKVIIEPNSKVIFVKGADGNNRILVEYGTINADMKSKEKTFFVEMPSAVASDIGGTYTLTIDSTGDGLVYVKSGKVEVQSPNKGSIVPAGNLVITKKDIGVGTPFNENSSPQFKNALFNFDFGKCSGSCVNTLLNTAKLSDAVTLVNLIPKIDNEYKDDVYAKVANFVQPPNAIHRDSIPFLNEDEINKWVEKIQIEVNENVERSLRDVEKNLENLKSFEKFNMDSLKSLEDFAKNWKFKIKTHQDRNYKWDSNTVYFDKEQFKQDMEEMKKDLKENQNFDKEQFKQDMENLKENLKDMQENLKENLNLNNEELKKEMEKVKEEIKNAVKEVEKAKKLKINIDSVKVKSKDGFDNDNGSELPEKIEAPETPGSEEK